MDITGWVQIADGCHFNGAGNAFYTNTNRGNAASGNWYNSGNCRAQFQASRNWSGSTSNSGSHSHTVTLNKSAIYGKSETVQPNALKLRVKCRAK